MRLLSPSVLRRFGKTSLRAVPKFKLNSDCSDFFSGFVMKLCMLAFKVIYDNICEDSLSGSALKLLARLFLSFASLFTQCFQNALYSFRLSGETVISVRSTSKQHFKNGGKSASLFQL